MQVIDGAVSRIVTEASTNKRGKLNWYGISMIDTFECLPHYSKHTTFFWQRSMPRIELDFQVIYSFFLG